MKDKEIRRGGGWKSGNISREVKRRMRRKHGREGEGIEEKDNRERKRGGDEGRRG